MLSVDEYLKKHPDNTRFITCGRHFNLNDVGEQPSGILICAAAGASCEDMANISSGKEMKALFIATAKSALSHLHLTGEPVKPFPYQKPRPR